MSGSRSVLTPTSTKRTKRYKRMGKPTDAEKALVAAFVADQPAELTSTQVNSLARTLRRTRETTLGLIEEARDRFIGSATDYVDMHKQATAAALANGDAKSLEVATRASQWAIDNISEGQTRIVDKAAAGTKGGGMNIMIGVKVGGLKEVETAQ